MSDSSKIEWTSATWSWVTGCTKISDGCLNCYIQGTPPFRIEHRKFGTPGIGGTTGVKLHSDRLCWPRRWRKPRKVFVNSLGDTFHEAVPAGLIAEAFAVMAACPQHVFQVLTKRHARMRGLLNDEGFLEQVQDRAENLGVNLDYFRWPLPNVHLGVSVESQQWADIRIPALIETPAAVRWLSCEPLIGELYLDVLYDHAPGAVTEFGTLCMCGTAMKDDGIGCYGDRIGWVVAGGESGPGARPCDLEWLRSLRRQCEEGGVPFFCKQLGKTLGREFGAGPKGGDWDAWPEDLRVREFPVAAEAVTT